MSPLTESTPSNIGDACELERAETYNWFETAQRWGEVEDAGNGKTAVRRLRVPFLLAYPGPGGRERLVIATSKQVADDSIKLLVRHPLPPFQPVRIRADYEGTARAWVRGVTLESVQTVGAYEINVEYAYRRSA